MNYLAKLLDAESKYRQFGCRDGSYAAALKKVSEEIIEAAHLGVAQDIFHTFDDEGHSFIVRAAVILDLRQEAVYQPEVWFLSNALTNIIREILDGMRKVSDGERP